MDVYLFELEHLAPGCRSQEYDCRLPGDASGELYDLAELNMMVHADFQRRAEMN